MLLFVLHGWIACLLFFLPLTRSAPVVLDILQPSIRRAPVVLDRHHGHHNRTFGHNRTFEHRNYETIRRIYNLTVYPEQIPILVQGAAAVPADLFNENATGRVSPVGAFEGFEDSIEYFFALAPIPQSNPLFAAISRIQITEFTSGCPDVAASVVYLFCNVTNPSSPDNGKALAPLKQVSGYSTISLCMRSYSFNLALFPGGILEV